ALRKSFSKDKDKNTQNTSDSDHSSGSDISVSRSQIGLGDKKLSRSLDPKLASKRSLQQRPSKLLPQREAHFEKLKGGDDENPESSRVHFDTSQSIMNIDESNPVITTRSLSKHSPASSSEDVFEIPSVSSSQVISSPDISGSLAASTVDLNHKNNNISTPNLAASSSGDLLSRNQSEADVRIDIDQHELTATRRSRVGSASASPSKQRMSMSGGDQSSRISQVRRERPVSAMASGGAPDPTATGPEGEIRKPPSPRRNVRLRIDTNVRHHSDEERVSSRPGSAGGNAPGSPGTGATVTIKTKDLIPNISRHSRSRSHSTTPSLGNQSQSNHSDGHDEPVPHQHPTKDADYIDDLDEEEEQLKAILTSSAAVKGSSRIKKGKKGRRGKKGEGDAGGDGGEGEDRDGGNGRRPARAAENDAGPVIEAGEPDILFVDDGGKFRRLLRGRNGDEDLEMNNQEKFDNDLIVLTYEIDTNASYILHSLHGIYAGICLLSLISLPITLPLNTETQDGINFLSFYSQISQSTSRLFAITGTAAVLATFDGGAAISAVDRPTGIQSHRKDGVQKAGRWWKSVGEARRPWIVGAVRWWRLRSGRGRRIAGVLGVICACISYVLTIVMTPVDDKLYESQASGF
ncbi:hypothetical protein HDU76_009249, partial [Blyttiomyces sp. JEL0837]